VVDLALDFLRRNLPAQEFSSDMLNVVIKLDQAFAQAPREVAVVHRPFERGHPMV